jgi:hypothetical protein
MNKESERISNLMTDLYDNSPLNKTNYEADDIIKFYTKYGYKEKEIIKSYNGLWDSTKKKWYFLSKQDYKSFLKKMAE